MALNTTLKKVATKLIAKFGSDVTLVSVTEGKYNPATGTSKTETQSTIKAFISVYKSMDYNEVVKVGDAPMMSTAEVKVSDEIIANGKRYRVVHSEALPLENGIVMYQCNLRALV